MCRAEEKFIFGFCKRLFFFLFFLFPGSSESAALTHLAPVRRRDTFVKCVNPAHTHTHARTDVVKGRPVTLKMHFEYPPSTLWGFVFFYTSIAPVSDDHRLLYIKQEVVCAVALSAFRKQLVLCLQRQKREFLAAPAPPHQ